MKMSVEQQVANKELSLRLQNLGVRQESVYCWKHLTMSPSGQIDEWVLSRFPGLITSDYFLAAFTVAELGEMLPGVVTMKNVTDWTAQHRVLEATETAGTEADARAKMLIHLIENNLITLEK